MENSKITPDFDDRKRAMIVKNMIIGYSQSKFQRNRPKENIMAAMQSLALPIANISQPDQCAVCSMYHPSVEIRKSFENTLVY